MQTKITFAGGSRSATTLGTFNHENMHQWWGDNVSEERVQPDLLQGGLRDDRRVPATAAARRPPAAAPAGRGVRDQPDQPVQRELRDDEHDVLDVGAVEPDGRQPVHDANHLHPARHGVPRALAGARPRPDDLGDEGHPEHVRRRQHHGAAARRRSSARGCRRRAPHAAPGSTSTSPSGSTPRIRQAARTRRTSRRCSGPGLNGTGFVCAAGLAGKPRRARTAGTRARCR